MRLATIPCATAIERAPLHRGVAGDAEQRKLGTHVNLAASRAIYTGRDAADQHDAVCIEVGDAVWRFTVQSVHVADRWTKAMTHIAGAH